MFAGLYRVIVAAGTERGDHFAVFVHGGAAGVFMDMEPVNPGGETAQVRGEQGADRSIVA